jgi:hypothetical protein
MAEVVAMEVDTDGVDMEVVLEVDMDGADTEVLLEVDTDGADTKVVSEEVMSEDTVTMVMVWEWVLDSPITGLILPILTILTHPIILLRPL